MSSWDEDAGFDRTDRRHPDRQQPFGRTAFGNVDVLPRREPARPDRKAFTLATMDAARDLNVMLRDLPASEREPMVEHVADVFAREMRNGLANLRMAEGMLAGMIGLCEDSLDEDGAA